MNLKYVTLDHKTSHKCQFFEIEISTSSESWINTLSIDVWFGSRLKKITILRKSAFDMFTVGNLLNICMEHDLYLIYFWHKWKIINFDLYNAFLAFATNIPQWLKNGFVVHGHIWFLYIPYTHFNIFFLNVGYKKTLQTFLLYCFNW